MTSQKHLSEVTKFKNKGYRLLSVDGYTVNSKVKFATIWKKGKTSGLRIRHGLNNKAY